MADPADLLAGPGGPAVELGGGDGAADAVVRATTAEDLAALGGDAARLAAVTGFTARPGEWLPRLSADGAAMDALLGLGPAAALDVEVLRRCAGRLAARIADGRWPSPPTVDVDLGGAWQALGAGTAVRSVADGLLDGWPGAAPPARFRLVGLDGLDGRGELDDVEDARAALRLGLLTAEGVALARRLVDAPPGRLGPGAMAAVAAAVAEREGLDARVLGDAELAAGSMGGLLAVGRGSDDGPRLVELHSRPPGASRSVALVGKGITFDSGGLSLKAPDAIVDMKLDMAGAAAVLGAVSVVARLDLPIAVSAYLPLAENMPGPTAVRVGEVVRTRNGLEVEVRNTDFEGRVVLADALAYASEPQPDLLVDLATLTDACTVALGDDIAGVLGHDDAVAAVEAAARAAGEPVWRLPLARRYADRLASDVADVSNHPGNRTGRAITAALFLERFVGDGVPWAHVDMVGPAFRTGGADRGATGFGVRTLVQLLQAAAG